MPPPPGGRDPEHPEADGAAQPLLPRTGVEVAAERSQVRRYGADALCAVESEGVTGAITGRAIYEGTLNFGEAQARADELSKVA